MALREAQITAADLDVVELHDAFTVEEVEYVEAMGLCADGQAVPLLKEGAFDIGGRCAVSPSGGLISMGHPDRPHRRRPDRRDHPAAARRSRRAPAARRPHRASPTWSASARSATSTFCKGPRNKSGPCSASPGPAASSRQRASRSSGYCLGERDLL